MNAQIEPAIQFALIQKDNLNKKKETKIFSGIKSVKSWLSKELTPAENVPQEFRDFFPKNQNDHFKHYWHTPL